MPAGPTEAAEPAIGATLIVIGAIVGMAAGLYLWNDQRTKPARRAASPQAQPPAQTVTSSL